MSFLFYFTYNFREIPKNPVAGVASTQSGLLHVLLLLSCPCLPSYYYQYFYVHNLGLPRADSAEKELTSYLVLLCKLFFYPFSSGV